MSKIADVLLIFSGLVFLLTVAIRVTDYSNLIIGQGLGFTLASLIAVSFTTSCSIRAEDFGCLRGNVVFVAVFGFLCFFLDLIFGIQYFYNANEKSLVGYVFMVITLPAFLLLKKDLKGKQWFGT